MRERVEGEHLIVHTGQHYDAALSAAVMRDLDFPAVDTFLGVGSGSHGAQTAATLERFERTLLATRPDLVIVAGDVNATLACALAGAKLSIPIAHVESGLRSHDWSMPEEINRTLTDRLSQVLLTHSPEAESNLVSEGIERHRIHFVGNTMIDSLKRLLPAAARRRSWRSFDVREGQYLLVTLHRPSNVDEERQLRSIVNALAELRTSFPIIFPLHPRTRRRLEELDLLGVLEAHDIVCGGPAGYIDFLSLLSAAGAVITDSGGVQEETTALGIACYTLRDNTERPITISHGTNELLGRDPASLERVVLQPSRPTAVPLWDGLASVRAAEILSSVFDLDRRRHALIA